MLGVLPLLLVVFEVKLRRFLERCLFLLGFLLELLFVAPRSKLNRNRSQQFKVSSQRQRVLSEGGFKRVLSEGGITVDSI